jgi:hypothetical protein
VRVSQVPGGSRSWHALLSDPGEVVVDWSRITTVLPSALVTASALATSPISRLHHTACLLHVYASQYGSPHDHARLSSGCGPAWPGGVGYPRGSNEKFPPSSGFPLSQASPGARIMRASGGHSKRHPRTARSRSISMNNHCGAAQPQTVLTRTHRAPAHRRAVSIPTHGAVA